MTNPNQLCDVLLFVCFKMADQTNLSSTLPVSDTTREVWRRKLCWWCLSSGFPLCTFLSKTKKMMFLFRIYFGLCFLLWNASFISVELAITKTYLYNFDPLKPHFYIVKLGFTGVYTIFLIFAQKHRLWVLVRTASPRRYVVLVRTTSPRRF